MAERRKADAEARAEASQAYARELVDTMKILEGDLDAAEALNATLSQRMASMHTQLA